jgi:hypothetical protein
MLPLLMESGIIHVYELFVCEKIKVFWNYRNRDKLPVVAKLSHQPLRLEREYHIVQRLHRQIPARKLLCKPLDRITISNNGLIAFIYQDLCDNQLEKFQPYNTPELLHSQQPLINNDTFYEKMSMTSFLQFAIQCCNCLEMIHKNQSKISLFFFLFSFILTD